MVLRVVSRVVKGRIRVDIPVDWPENTEVELAVIPPDEGAVEDDPALNAALDASEAEIASGAEGTPAEDVLERLRKRSLDEALPGKPDPKS